MNEIETIKHDMLKIMDKLDEQEQMFINLRYRLDAIDKKVWNTNINFNEEIRKVRTDIWHSNNIIKNNKEVK